MSELARSPETETRPLRRTGPMAGTAFATEWTLEQTAGTAGSSPDAPVLLVVGFDGSEPAQRALDAAAELLRQHGPDATVVLVVGGSSNKHLHVAGSVSSNLAQVDRFPLVVV